MLTIKTITILICFISIGINIATLISMIKKKVKHL